MYCYDADGNMTSRGGSAISWYSYNQPNQINSGTNSAQFSYNANHQRWKQVAIDGTGTTTTWTIGGILEKLTRPGGVTEYRHLIPAGSGMAIYLRKPDGTNSTTYVTTDHLGSGDLILDSAATVLARESFTPFGARRGSNWSGTPTAADYTTFSNTTRRGFTGHEMLDAVGLVNMNGRVYDPLIGRFLSADPIIQTIALCQALNPYSYVMNMPLTLTDPSGYSWLSKLFHSIGHFLKKWGGVIIGVVMTIMGQPWYWATLASAAFNAAANGGNFIQSFVTGAIIGLITGGIANKLGLSAWAERVVGNTGNGLLNSVLQGALTGAIIGAATSVALGGSFWAGFTGGALVGAVTSAVMFGTQRYLEPNETTGSTNQESGGKSPSSADGQEASPSSISGSEQTQISNTEQDIQSNPVLLVQEVPIPDPILEAIKAGRPVTPDELISRPKLTEEIRVPDPLKPPPPQTPTSLPGSQPGWFHFINFIMRIIGTLNNHSIVASPPSFDEFCARNPNSCA